MILSQVEYFLNSWSVGTPKIFFYTDHEFIKDYLKIYKMEDFTFLVDGESTRQLKNSQILYKEEIIKLLCQDQLSELFDIGKTPRELKTGGCSCGSWIFGSNYPHTDWCDSRKWWTP